MTASARALSAILLPALGIDSVVSYSAVQRTREVGVRIALGASRGSILRLVLRDTVTMVGIGLVLGLVGAGRSGCVPDCARQCPSESPGRRDGVSLPVLGKCAIIGAMLDLLVRERHLVFDTAFDRAEVTRRLQREIAPRVWRWNEQMSTTRGQ